MFLEIAFFSCVTTSRASFSEFDARNAILFQIKVFGRKLKVITLSRSFIKLNTCPSLFDQESLGE